jgi:solute carrier family 25 carnitine/acylcarnitine transporter 20/29
MEEVDSVLVENVKSFAAGGFGGICAVLTGHPFDLTKVLLQTNKYSTTSQAIKGTLSAHGPFGFYKGVTSPLLGVTPMFAVSFWGYDLGKRLVISSRGKSPDEPLTIAEISTAGFFSAIPTTLIAAPFERIKVVMQIDKEVTSFGATVKKLYAQGGISSIYKGSIATLARDGPGSAAYFATYEYIKNYLSKDNKDGEISLSAITIAGGCAGVVMWTAIFPIDTIKSIQQSSAVKTSISQVTKNIYKTKGIGGFFPGIVPALARSFPANAATFLGVELAKKLMN